MRIAVFLLVLANLLFFAWTRAYLGSDESGESWADAELRTEQIRIVSKDRPPEKRVEVENALPAEPPREEICAVLSEVSPGDAEAIERLFAERLPAFRLSRTDRVGNTAYWVHIPPFRTRPEAESKVAELKRLGVKEYFILQDGADGFAISLGLFSTPGAAESALAALREKGVRSARLIARPHKSNPSQIEFLGPRTQAGEMRQIIGEAWPQAKLDACGRTAAAQATD